jgi:phosphoribosylanthranilate isomerase
VSDLARFLDRSHVSLKICGVTTCADGGRLADMGVDALGVNFWPSSKRYLAAAEAGWLLDLAGRILRVGVFVNEQGDLPVRLYDAGLIDVIQLHGDELPEDLVAIHAAGAPVIKAIGVKTRSDLSRAVEFGAAAILLDAHAPGVYGGTGVPFDWDVAVDFQQQHPELPVILAGGITAANAGMASARVRPAALDIASGAESVPGMKDFDKVAAIRKAMAEGC